jgi:hypothetical protein
MASRATARTVILPVQDSHVLGQQGMAGVTCRQGAQHLDHTGVAGTQWGERDGVSHDDIGTCRGMEVTVFTFHEDRSALLHHSVVVEYALDAQLFAQPGLEGGVVDLLILEALPATAVDECAASAEVQLASRAQGALQQAPATR